MNAIELVWNKSSYSTNEATCCVEIAKTPATIHVRDSKDAHGPALTLTPTAWTAFLHLATTHR